MNRIFLIATIVGQFMFCSANSWASGYDTCKLEANVLKKGKMTKIQKDTVVSLSFEVVGLPVCEGYGIKTFQAGQTVAADVVIPEGINATGIKKGTKLSLAYSYCEGLTPEGAMQSENWKLVSVSKK